MNSNERMPALSRDQMDDAQRAAADELVAGPRKGVKGPFIPLLRSPQLMARLQKVGEYLRFESVLSRRVNEFVTCVVSREWTQQFEWATHVPLAIAAGTAPSTIEALREGRRPTEMSREEEVAYAREPGLDVVIVFEDPNNLPFTGVYEGSSASFASLLKPVMEDGTVTIVGETTAEALAVGLATRPEFRRLFSELKMEPPEGEKLRE